MKKELLGLLGAYFMESCLLIEKEQSPISRVINLSDLFNWKLVDSHEPRQPIIGLIPSPELDLPRVDCENEVVMVGEYLVSAIDLQDVRHSISYFYFGVGQLPRWLIGLPQQINRLKKN